MLPVEADAWHKLIGLYKSQKHRFSMRQVAKFFKLPRCALVPMPREAKEAYDVMQCGVAFLDEVVCTEYQEKFDGVVHTLQSVKSLLQGAAAAPNLTPAQKESINAVLADVEKTGVACTVKVADDVKEFAADRKLFVHA